MVPVHVPTISLIACCTPPPDDLRKTVLITSAAIVRFVPHLASLLEKRRVIAVGRATARALAGVRVDAVGVGGGAAALDLLGDTPACFIGAARPAPALSAAVASGRLLHWAVYDRIVPSDVGDRLRVVEVDVVTLASPSAAAVVARHVPHLDCVVIGETTRRAALAEGLRVVGVAERPGMVELAEAARRASMT